MRALEKDILELGIYVSFLLVTLPLTSVLLLSDLLSHVDPKLLEAETFPDSVFTHCLQVSRSYMAAQQR